MKRYLLKIVSACGIIAFVLMLCPLSGCNTPVSSEPPQPELTIPIVTSEPETRIYTIKTGDSLWKIAETELGDGKRYKEIVELNPQIIYYTLNAGDHIKIPVK